MAKINLMLEQGIELAAFEEKWQQLSGAALPTSLKKRISQTEEDLDSHDHDSESSMENGEPDDSVLDLQEAKEANNQQHVKDKKVIDSSTNNIFFQQ